MTAKKPVEVCNNKGCGRPRLVAPGVLLCTSCRIAFLSGYQEGFSKRQRALEARVKELEAEVGGRIETSALIAKERDEWWDRAEKAEAVLKHALEPHHCDPCRIGDHEYCCNSLNCEGCCSECHAPNYRAAPQEKP
jgi:hypothetical protein